MECHTASLIFTHISSLQGPASELNQAYNLTPADLYNLNAKFIENEKETQFRSYLINISWSLSMDGKFNIQMNENYTGFNNARLITI